MYISRTMICVLIFAACFSSIAQAEDVTFGFYGSVIEVGDPNDVIGDAVIVGDTVIGAYKFNPQTPDSDHDDPTQGVYQEAIEEIDINIGGENGVTFCGTPGPGDVIFIGNDLDSGTGQRDVYQVFFVRLQTDEISLYPYLWRLNLFLQDFSATVFDSDALPTDFFCTADFRDPRTAVIFDDTRSTFTRINIEHFFNAGPIVPVTIDIRPGSEQNVVNQGSQGLVPVAIISGPGFDATTVNPCTIRLGASAVRLAGKSGRHLCQHSDVNNDGATDFVCEVEIVLGIIEEGADEAILRAVTSEGDLIEGRDVVHVVPNN